MLNALRVLFVTDASITTEIMNEEVFVTSRSHERAFARLPDLIQEAAVSAECWVFLVAKPVSRLTLNQSQVQLYV